MKRILLIFLGIVFSFTLFAESVNPEQAAKIAKNFYMQMSINKGVSNFYLSLAFTVKSMDVSTSKGMQGQEIPLIYIFNVNQNDGFVIVSADNSVSPILGYSLSGTYTGTNLPPAFIKLIEKYKKEIVYVIINQIESDNEISRQWRLLEIGESLFNAKATKSVNPLIATHWDQLPYYNAMCPYDYSYSERTITGCVATAMAQIMKFWNYPATGSGMHSYNHATYGTLSANFAATTYDWSAMPNNVTSANSAVATLMYHCGVSVDMNYGVASTGGSGTNTLNCVNSYKDYFKYSSTVQGKYRSDYTDNAWINLLKTELDAGRPVHYAGTGTGGGHSFVCDGYDNNDFFHFNWGWSGSSDGYFNIDALNPGSLGSGGGSGGFNTNQRAIIGIQPASGSVTSIINMNSSITVSPNPIDFAQSFTVNADVTNAGTSNFSGDYCAALFTSSGDFIDYIQTLTASGSPLQPGYHYTGGLTFSNSGMLTVPGNYIVGIFYRDPSGNWNLAGNSSYSNPISVTINSPSDYIQLYSTITPSPTTFVQGQSASVNFNLINDNSATYYGSYRANLYDLEGNFVQTIGTINETNGLPAGYIYSSPYITLSTSSITATPGTYILAIEELENGYSDWYLVGGQYHPNPINIIVVEPSLSPDIYEANNNESSAYNLPLAFSSGTATKNTNGSNLHIGSDLDYYKVDLPTGFNYSISARVHDSYSSGNGQTYTGDVLFSYYNGFTWSEAYDDVLSSNISITNGGSVIFKVSPYYTGETGTYLLDMSITQTVGINEIEDISNSISLYPNPANEFVNFDFTNCSQKISNLKVYDNIGREISSYSLSEFSGKVYPLSVADFSNGLYFVGIVTDKYVITKRFTIQK